MMPWWVAFLVMLSRRERGVGTTSMPHCLAKCARRCRVWLSLEAVFFFGADLFVLIGEWVVELSSSSLLSAKLPWGERSLFSSMRIVEIAFLCTRMASLTGWMPRMRRFTAGVPFGLVVALESNAGHVAKVLVQVYGLEVVGGAASYVGMGARCALR